jgi:hypothetical protein
MRRERDLGAIVGDSFTILFANFRPLAAVVFPAVVTSIAVSVVLLAIENAVAAFVASIVAFAVQFAVYEVVEAAGVGYLDARDRGEPLTSADALDRAQERLGIILGAAIRAFAISFLMAITIVGIPWAVMRFIRWAFLSQTIMIEDKRGEAVLASSAELVRGYWWVTFGRLIVTTLVVGFPAFVVYQVAAVAISLVIGGIVSGLLVFVTAPYAIISTTLMYFDLKTRKARHDSTSPDRHTDP